jgi:uncharacterized protein YjbI with pentapeptide repeats
MNMTQSELDKILADHKLWLDDDGGSCANLIDADLSGANLIDADLSCANLSRADLSGANLSCAKLIGANLIGAYLSGADLSGEILKISPVQVIGLPWHVLITQEFMVIGCQRHSHIEWADFSDEKIANMESRTSEFWKVWKEPLLMMCSKYAAEYASV